MLDGDRPVGGGRGREEARNGPDRLAGGSEWSVCRDPSALPLSGAGESTRRGGRQPAPELLQSTLVSRSTSQRPPLRTTATAPWQRSTWLVCRATLPSSTVAVEPDWRVVRSWVNSIDWRVANVR